MELLYSSYFKYLVFPVVCLLGTLMLKATMRPQASPTFRREDLVIGNELVWLSLTILLAGVSEKATQYRDTQTLLTRMAKEIPQKSYDAMITQTGLGDRAGFLVDYLAVGGYVVFAFFFVALALSLAMKMFAWDANGVPHLWRGIGLPIIVGLLSLGMVMKFLSVPLL